MKILKYLLTVLFGSLLSTVSAQTVSGTGFLISSDGYVVTNFHVVANSNSFTVKDKQGNFKSARLALTDSANDIAVLKIDGERYQPLKIKSSSSIKKGELVFTIGFPNILVQGFDAKVTEGIVSSLAGIRGEPNSFQVSVPIQPGNSGGPLLDKQGSVVGIVTAKLSASAMLESSGSIPEGVNYAVKANYLKELIATDSNVSRAVDRSSTGLPEFNRASDLATIVERVEKSIVLILASSESAKPTSNANNQKPAPSRPMPSNSPPSKGSRDWCPDIDAFCDTKSKNESHSPSNPHREWCPEIDAFCDTRGPRR